MTQLRVFDGRLRRRQTSDRHTEGRAGHIVQTDLVAELDRRRVAAVLAADAAMQGRVDTLAQLHSHLHQSANALLIQLRERIVLVDLGVIVGIQELTSVVTAEAKGHLGQVVGAEAEEVNLFRDLVRRQSSTRDLDHGAHFVFQIDAGRRDLRISGSGDNIFHEFQLFDLANQRDHDFGDNVPIGVRFFHIDRRTDNRLGLHFRDFRIGDGNG